MSTRTRRIFVYGTLKRGLSNHHHLAGQAFIGEAATRPGYRLFDLGGYPGLIRDATAGHTITGEVWEVNETALRRLDVLEDVAGGEYAREPVGLLPPFDTETIEGYLYLRPVAGLREVGGVWQ